MEATQKRTRIKVCRVEDIDTAKALSSLGVDFIGLHLVSRPTCDRISQLGEIIKWSKITPNAAHPVLVIKNLNAEEIIDSVLSLRPLFVQLHDAWDYSQLSNFRDKFPESTKIIVVLDPVLGVNTWLTEQVKLADFILLDRIQGGTGNPLPSDKVLELAKSLQGCRIFLAGGLNVDNVNTAIASFSPYAVDVQSALEIPGKKGKKDIIKTKAFVMAVRNDNLPVVQIVHDKSQSILCLSLTDYPASEIRELNIELLRETDGVHLDHADGSVDVRFCRNSAAHAKALQEYFPLHPYDLHLFLTPISQHLLTSVLDEYLRYNTFMRTLFCYVDPLNEMITKWPMAQCKNEVHSRGVGFGLCFQARHLSENVSNTMMHVINSVELDSVSVVGPSDTASPEEYNSVVEPCVRYLQQILAKHIPVIVDRSISTERLISLNKLSLSGAVVGKSVWQSNEPLGRVNHYRSILEKSNISPRPK